ncbi:XRE family transcriptional regulator [Rhodovibrionaceae bacterium A322]
MTQKNSEIGGSVADRNAPGATARQLGLLVRSWRLDNNLSQPQLAQQLGVTQQAVQQLESGRTRAPRYLLKLARLMSLDAEALSEGRSVPLSPQAQVTGQPLAPADAGIHSAFPSDAANPVATTSDVTDAIPAPPGPRDLPVYASAQAGPDGMTVSYDPIEWLERPAPLASVPNAFAMYVVNDSMEPRFRQGDLLLIHPQRPIRRGQTVLIIQRDEAGEERAYVKELLQLTADQVTLRQLNPDSELTLARASVTGLHLVVGVHFTG